MSSTDQIYHLAASPLGDKCDRSMTRDKLLDNNPTLFIFFISILMMTQGTRKQTTEPILGTPIFGNGDQVTTATAVSQAFLWYVRLSSNIPGFVSVDLIGENNQVILQFIIPNVPFLQRISPP